ncbi:Na+/H+ antiporter subunit E [Pseudomonas saliphila]|uniref:Na+/H+ antiporter subunit E n=1 Tax=Pseudomonas saliphila TaxID=2586906 RepID=UPI001F1C8333|nr:Na+/H+ antiporter subunit E [Pseudomonas saliphila]
MPYSWADRFLSRRMLFWSLLYVALWGLLAGGKGWYIGIPCALAAAMLACWLGNPVWTFRPRAVPGFLLFFLRALVAGGWDVARRAVQPRMPLDPAWVSYPLTARDPRSRLLLAAAVSLLPGTLAGAIEADHLALHVLDHTQPWLESVARLEQQLMHVLGEGPA